MLLDIINGYSFLSRSGGVVVLEGDTYVGFFDTLDAAISAICPDEKYEF
jgi:hypothetical protein